MNNKKILSQAKQLIANNKVDQALELLSGAFNSEYNNEIIQHTNNFNDLKQKERLGIINFSDANTFKNQIVAALLALVNEIEKDKKPSLKENEVEKPPQQVINIINSQNVNVGDVNTDGGGFKIGDTEIIMEIKNINEGDINAKDVHIGDIYSKSIDYKEILSRIEELEELVESANNQEKKLKYSRRLNKVIKQKDHFIKEVISLAQIFQTIRINKERLKKAKHFFFEGKLKEARALLELNVEQIGKNQKQLLNQKLDIAEKSKQNEKDLRHNADEYLVLAKLTSIDYKRKDRFAKTLEYFELSLKADRNEENLFYYAHFLQGEGKHKQAISLNEKVVEKVEKLIPTNQKKYLLFLSRTKQNLAFSQYEISLIKEAEKSLDESRKILNRLNKDFKESYIIDIGENLIDIGFLYNQKNEFAKSEDLYKNALHVFKPLAKLQPELHSILSAEAFSKLGILKFDEGVFFKSQGDLESIACKISEARNFFLKSLEKYESLQNSTKQYPNILSKYAEVCIKYGNLLLRIQDSEEAVSYYKTALDIFEYLNKIKPDFYLKQEAGVRYNLEIAKKQMNTKTQN